MKSGNRPTTTPKSNITGELRNWYRVGKMYGGNIYGDTMKRFKDGKFVYTSIIDDKKTVDRHDYLLVTTFGGTRYIMYKDKHHKEKLDAEL